MNCRNLLIATFFIAGLMCGVCTASTPFSDDREITPAKAVSSDQTSLTPAAVNQDNIPQIGETAQSGQAWQNSLQRFFTKISSIFESFFQAIKKFFGIETDKPAVVSTPKAISPTPGPLLPQKPETTTLDIPKIQDAGMASQPTPATSSPNPGNHFPMKTDSIQIEKVWKNAGMTGSLSGANYPSNGGRPAAVYVPANLDPAKPVKVVTLFHGHYWNIGDKFRTNGVLSKIKELEKQNPNTVFVIPQAAQPPFSYWMKSPRENYADFMSQALNEATRLKGVAGLAVSERIVSAHSGGGLAIRNAITSGQFQADKIELLDANYGDWGEVMAKWAQGQPGKKPSITAWDTAGDTRKHDGEILKLAPDLVTVNTSAVSHNNIPGRYFGATINSSAP